MLDQAKAIVEQAISELNQTRGDGAAVGNDLTTPLLSSNSAVDSLALVTLFISIEQIADDDYDKQITVVNESAFEAEESPFKTVGSLTAHIGRLLEA